MRLVIKVINLLKDTWFDKRDLSYFFINFILPLSINIDKYKIKLILYKMSDIIAFSIIYKCFFLLKWKIINQFHNELVNDLEQTN